MKLLTSAYLNKFDVKTEYWFLGTFKFTSQQRVKSNDKLLNVIRLDSSLSCIKFCTQLHMFVFYYTKVIYKIMDTEVLTSCVNTINLILQEVKYVWNVRCNGKCSTHIGVQKRMELNCFSGGKTSQVFSI
jgi:hypothetical protein